MIRGAFVFVILAWVSQDEQVAELRAVLPLARLNEVVLMAFSSLFTPAAARLFADNRRQELGELYCSTTAWIAVLTFPVLAASCCLADVMVQMLFGTAYADAGALLPILAVGYFTQAAFGFNARTLRVMGRVRLTAAIDFAAAGLALLLFWLLIPGNGARGASMAITLTILAHVFVKQAALWRYGGIDLFRSPAFRLHATCLVSIVVLFAIANLIAPPTWLMIVLIAACSAIVFRVNADLLQARRFFPELDRIPFVRSLDCGS
jgi:O-antigen/teichoic acid export membrane protein